MTKAIRLRVMTGPHQNSRFCFCGPTQCHAGRGFDCFIQLTGTERDQLISRDHCQMEFAPPLVHIRDLGSRNGTFVNGRRIASNPLDDANPDELGVLCHDGDLITLGGTTLQVEVIDCPHAGSGEEPGWDGDLAKKDCQLPCEK